MSSSPPLDGGEERAADDRQNRLRELATRLTCEDREERRRLAQVMHDDVCQPMAMAMMLLDSLQRAPAADPSENLKRIRDLVARAIEQTRAVSLELSPAMLFALGLVPAVEALASETRRKHGLPVIVHGDLPGAALPAELRILLYETIRQLLDNVIQHAHATRAWVSLVMDDSDAPRSGIRIEVQDDGVGFDADAKLNSNRSLGLFNIQTLMEQIGGCFTLATRPGAGATVTCWAPLSQPTSSLESTHPSRRDL
ncbi:MAG TPA: ATP-binding protein [Tepidisphaeraceae bacterium]|nr:ATP-binding protein [Tepidisphaeraceae bacterium]